MNKSHSMRLWKTNWRAGSVLFVVIPVVGLVAGCGGSELPLVPVIGKVTFDGGNCPSPGTIEFVPLDMTEGHINRPATAQFDVDGRFRATSFKPGDGLMPGRYTVKVTCTSGVPDMRRKDPWGDVSLVDPDYEPETLVVEAGSREIKLELDVPRKKT